MPEHLRSDNRPEFYRRLHQDWLEAQEIKSFTQARESWENGQLKAFTTSCG
jgi:hypothetical protein